MFIRLCKVGHKVVPKNLNLIVSLELISVLLSDCFMYLYSA